MNPTYATDPKGILRSFASKAVVKDQSGTKIAETRYEYNNPPLGTVTKGRVSKQERWLQAAASPAAPATEKYSAGTFSYDTYVNVRAKTDPLGNETKVAYGPYFIFLATQQNSKGHTVKAEFDLATSRPTLIEDENGLQRHLEYDAFARLKKVLLEHSALSGGKKLVREATYDQTTIPNFVQVREFADETQATATESFEYVDGFARSIQSRQRQDAVNFAVTHTVYDTKDRVEKASLPKQENGSAFVAKSSSMVQSDPHLAFQYDGLDRVIETSHPVGTEQVEFQGVFTNPEGKSLGWKKVVTDAKGRKKEYFTDAFGHLRMVRELLSGQAQDTQYEYDLLGNVTKITDSQGNIRNLTYDSLGRRLSAEDLHAPSDASFAMWQYAYDDGGNLLKQINPDGTSLTWTYDSLSRPLSENLSDTPFLDITYTYDQGNFALGKLAQATRVSARPQDPTSTITVMSDSVYNALWQESSEKKTFTGLSATTLETKREYDLLDRKVHETLPSGTQL